MGYAIVTRSGEHGFSFSIGFNRQVLNRVPQQILGPPTKGEGYYGPTTVRYLSFAGYKNIIVQTFPLKVSYEF